MLISIVPASSQLIFQTFLSEYLKKINLHSLSLVFTVKIKEDGDSMQSFCIWDTLTSPLLLLHCILWISGCSNLIICCMRPLIFRLGQSTLLYSADLIYHCRESALVQKPRLSSVSDNWLDLRTYIFANVSYNDYETVGIFQKKFAWVSINNDC